jgi:hypothetical protein
MTNIADAAVSILDMPGFETTSDMDGAFTVGPIDPNQEIVFEVAPSMDHVGSYIPFGVEDADDDSVRLGQISREFLAMQEQLLVDTGQMPEPVTDPTQVVIVRLVSPTALMDGNVVVNMEPAPLPNTYYAPDAAGAPVINSNEMQFSLIPVVVFYNVGENAIGDLSFTFDHPTDTCETAYTQFPTADDHITLVDVTCS